MTKKVGLKEAALKLMREEANEIPAFLKREETPEQAEKRRKKYAKRDATGGLTVIEPVDPKIRKAIEKDLKEKHPADRDDCELDDPLPYEPKPKKKLPPVLAKAMAQKEMLEKLTQTPMESTVKKAKAKKVNSPKKANGVREGTKLEKVVALLKRREGCTTADVLKATGWPSVSMPQQAKAAGLTLKKEKVDGITHYKAG